MKKIQITFILILAVLNAAVAGQIYVHSSAAGSNNGSSWTNAFVNLQSALNAAVAGDSIFVAKGTYTPHASDAGISFQMKSGVELFGGFSASEDISTFDFTTRDFHANASILSGDLNGDDVGFVNNIENSQHVVWANSIDTCVVDGFTITGGKSESINKGGGIYCSTSKMTIKNCVVIRNEVNWEGAGMVFLNCDTILIVNTTIANNLIHSMIGSGINTDNSPVTCINTIIHDNYDDEVLDNIAVRNAGVFYFQNSMLQGSGGSGGWVSSSAIDLGNNIDANPLFVDAATLDFRMYATSNLLGMGDVAFGSNIGQYQGAGEPVVYSEIYVDDDATGANNGSSWADAFVKITDAVAAAKTYTKIYVAAGTYIPDSTDITASFNLKNYVEIFGGFNGTETGIDEAIIASRDFIANASILSGDLLANDVDTANMADNSYHILHITNVDTTAVLDGFVVEKGNANATGDNRIGSAMWIDRASPTIRNVFIHSNYAIYNGAALYLYYSDARFENATITNNHTLASYAGTAYCFYSDAVFSNCIIANNTLNGASSFSNTLSTPQFDYCLVEGSGGSGASWYSNLGIDNGNNLGGNPLMSAPNSPLAYDISPIYGSGKPAMSNIGYYQGNGIPVVYTEVYVDAGATGANNGTSWTDAYTSLQDALQNAELLTKIYVAAGTYIPHATDRASYFILKNYVELYGGFAGNETSIDQSVLNARDFSANETILSGDLLGDDVGLTNNIENSYHVLYANNINSSVIVDGFTVSGGNASGTSTTTYGGGIYMSNSAVMLSNLTFTNNNASYYGACIYASGGSINLHNASMLANRSNYNGAGIFANAAELNIGNVFMGNNTARYHGAGLYLTGCSGSIVNTTVAGNVSDTYNYDGGLYAFNSPIQLINCLLSDNVGNAYNSSDSLVVVSHSFIQGSGGSGSWLLAGFADGGNNIDGASLLVDFTVNDELYEISPAIGAGNATYGANIGSYQGIGASFQQYVFVKKNASGLNDGTSWDNAYTDLQTAVNNALEMQKICVASGIYTPHASDRTVSFTFKSGITILGGFSGTEPVIDSATIADRDFQNNETVLSGDLLGDDVNFSNNLENSYHVVYLANTDSTLVIDGVTISGGNANGIGDQLNGGGVFIDGDFSNHYGATFNFVTFTNNYASNGAALYTDYSYFNLYNSLIIKNHAANEGAAFRLGRDAGIIYTNVVNSTIADNTSDRAEAGVLNYFGYLNIVNSILWNNTKYLGLEIENRLVTNVQNSIVQNSGGSSTWNASLGTDVGGNIDTDPLFVDALSNNYLVYSISPAIGSGNGIEGANIGYDQSAGVPKPLLMFHANSSTFPGTIITTASDTLTIGLHAENIINSVTISMLGAFEISIDSVTFSNEQLSIVGSGTIDTVIYVVHKPLLTTDTVGQLIATSLGADADTAVYWGRVLIPELTSSHTAIDFGTILITDTSAVVTLTLQFDNYIEGLNIVYSEGFEPIQETVSVGINDTTYIYELNIVAAPADGSTQTGTITISSPGIEDLIIPLSVEILYPQVSISETEVVFEDALINKDTVLAYITLTGENLISDMILKAPEGFGFYVNETTFTDSLAISPIDHSFPEAMVLLGFFPTEERAYAGTISIEADSVATLAIPVSGNGTVPVPELRASVMAIDFSNVIVGESLESMFTLSAIDMQSDLTITASADFEVSLTAGTGFAGMVTVPQVNGEIATTNIYIRFTPSLETTYIERLAFTATNLDEGIGVMGTGITAGGPAISTAPSFIEFGDVTVGTVSQAQNFALNGENLMDVVTITPTAGVELSADGVSYVAGAITINPTGGVISNQDIFIRFAPEIEFNYDVELEITSIGATNKYVFCFGRGVVEPFYNLSERVLEFGEVIISAEAAVQSFNLNATYLTGDFTLNSTADFQISESPFSGFANTLTISPFAGEIATTIYVQFNPALAESFSSYIYIASADFETDSIAVSGSGIARPNKFYVNQNAVGDGTGVSWVNAYTDLQVALANSLPNDTLFVASGVYVPHFSNRSISFNIPSGIALIGGFVGNESITPTLIESRDWETNATILSGDIYGNDNGTSGRDENSYHVVTINNETGNIQSNTVLDGFIVEGGNANDATYTEIEGGGINIRGEYMRTISPTLKNLVIRNNSAVASGGGINCNHLSTAGEVSPILMNILFENNESQKGGALYISSGLAASYLQGYELIFLNNSATVEGGAMYISSLCQGIAEPYFESMVLTKNSALDGTAIFIESSETYGGCSLSGGHCSPTIVNATITGNTGYEGEAIYSNIENGTCTPSFINTIIWNNTDFTNQIFNGNGAVPSFQNSLVENSGGSASWIASLGSDLGGNIDANPQIVDANNYDFRLYEGSPALGTGNNTNGVNIGWDQTEGLGAPVLSATVSDLTFLPTTIDVSSPAQTYHLTGANLLTSVSVSVVGPFEISDVLGIFNGLHSLNYTPENESLDVELFVRFVPLFNTDTSGMIIHTIDNGENDTIFLHGTVIEPMVEFSTNMLELGDVLVGETSTEKTFTISGRDLIDEILIVAPANVTISFTSGTGYSSVLNIAPTGGIIAPTTIHAIYSPTSPGGLLDEISFSSAEIEETVLVTGSGIRAGDPVITQSPSLLDFGTVTLGSVSNSLSFTVGGDNLNEFITISPVGVEISTDNDIFTAEPITYLPSVGGEIISVYVRMFSETVGLQEGYVELSSNGAISKTVLCKANGYASPRYEISQNEFNFGSVYAGQAEIDFNFTIDAQYLTGSMVLSAPTGYKLSTNGFTFTPILTLPSSGGVINEVVYVRFAPSTPGDYAGAITVSSSDFENFELLVNGNARAVPTLFYVKSGAMGSGFGLDWGNAFTNLQAALNIVSFGDTIVVAKGIYTPSESDRNVAFKIPSGVKVFGGFNGNEVITPAVIEARNWETNATILSGDLNGNDASGIKEDNSNHVVEFMADYGTILRTTVLDGFYVSDGYSNGQGSSIYTNHASGIFIKGYYGRESSPSIKNCIIENNYGRIFGGGMSIYPSTNNTSCNPIISNVIFRNNEAGQDGGAVYVAGSVGNVAPEFTNVQFLNNSAQSGGAIYNRGACSGVCNPTYTNILVCGNNASYQGGGIVTIATDEGGSCQFDGGTVNVSFINATIANNSTGYTYGGLYQSEEYGTCTVEYINSIIYSNGDNPIFNSIATGSATFANCDIELVAGRTTWDNNYGIDAGNNIFENPLFVSISDCDLRLLAGSPSVGAGDVAYGSNIGYYQGAALTNPPLLTVTGSIPSFGEVAIGSASEIYGISISGLNLTNDVMITAPYGFGLSLTSGAAFSSNDTIILSNTGTLAATTIYVRLVPTEAANYIGAIEISSAGALTRTVNVSGAGSNFNPFIYVKADAEGTNDGSSWANAYTSLQEALQNFEANRTIVVARGIYTPDPSVRTVYFNLTEGMKLYGGFAGTEEIIDQATLQGRDFESNETILSGDLNADGYIGNNSYHVVMIHAENASISNATILDGFTISNGNASDYTYEGEGGGILIYGEYQRMVRPVLRNLVVKNNSSQITGGGIAVIHKSTNGEVSPTLQNILFLNNASQKGGGLSLGSGLSANYTQASNLQFRGNSATLEGGAIYISSLCQGVSEPYLENISICSNSALDGTAIASVSRETYGGCSTSGGHCSPTFANVTITQNSGYQGEVLYNEIEDGACTPTFVNTIIWANSGYEEQIVNVNGAVPSFQNCLIENSGGSSSWVASMGTNLGGNIDSDPMFVHTSDCDLSLKALSPALLAGDTFYGSNIGAYQEAGIVVPPSLEVGITSIPFGDVEITQPSSISNFIISGADLLSDVVITPVDGFQISLAGGVNFTSQTSITLSPVLGTLNATAIYVRFAPSEAKAYSGSIDITNSELGSLQVAVSGYGIDPTQPNITLSGYENQMSAIYAGQTSYIEYIEVFGFNLSENITVTASSGITLSTYYDNYTSEQTVTLSQDAGYTNTLMYYRFEPTEVGEFIDTIEFRSAGATTKYLVIYAEAIPVPSVSFSVSDLVFESVEAGYQSMVQTFNISAEGIANFIELTPPSGFEIALQGSTLFSSGTLTLYTNDSIVNSTIQVRFSPERAGQYSGDIALTSVGAEIASLPVSGSATGAPGISAVQSMVMCRSSIQNSIDIQLTDETPETVEVTAYFANAMVFPNASIDVSGTGALRTLEISGIEQNGITTIWLVATDADNLKDSTSIVFEVYPDPRFMFTIFDEQACYSNSSVNAEFYVSYSEGPAIVYFDNEVNYNNYFYFFEEGTHTFQVFDQYTGCSVDTTFTITIPEPFLMRVVNIQNQNVNHLGSVEFEITGGTAPYRIEYNSSVITGTQVVNNLESGNYFFYISDSKNCSESTNIYIENEYWIDVEMPQLSVEVSPNPVKDQLTIQVGGLGSYTLKLLDSKGSVLTQFNSKDKIVSMNTEQLAVGTYTILLYKEDKVVASKKIVKAE